MKVVREIEKGNWDYTLYEVEDSYVITIVFFGRIDYVRSFHITEEEIKSGLKIISERIRNNYQEYISEEVKPPIIRESV